jgi:hypothetical protein
MEDLEDKNARELFIILEEWYRQNGLSSQKELTGELLDRIQDSGLKDFVLRQGATGAFLNPEKLLSDGMTRIKGKVLERKRREIILELKTPALEALRQSDLLAEKVHIDTELKRLKEGQTLPAVSPPPESKETIE